MNDKSITKIIKKHFRDGSKGIKCGFCDGEGSFPATLTDDIPPNAPCPVCNGKGINRYYEAIDELVICGLCKGEGKDWGEGYFLGDTCKICKGTGILKLRLNTENNINSLWSLLHPRIVKVSKSRFQSEHYADSVEAAFKEINKVGKDILKKKTKQEKDGVNVFETLFSMNNPIHCCPK